MAEYTRKVRGVLLKPEQCKYNEECRCLIKRCGKCGWNPSVAEQRLEKLKEANHG